jgi:TnpA family transposase
VPADFDAQRTPCDRALNLTALKTEVTATWPMTSLLDMAKEADPRLHITEALKSATAYETLDRSVPRPRVLPAIWGEGSTACGSESKHFGAWDQKLTTQWHVRYKGVVGGASLANHVARPCRSLIGHRITKTSEIAALLLRNRPARFSWRSAGGS